MNVSRNKITLTGFTGWTSGILVAAFVLISILAPFIANDSKNPTALIPIVKFGPETTDIFNSPPLEAPSHTHWVGTDYVGRDVFARLVHALRNSLFFSILVVLVCLVIGVLIGGLMGYLGGRFDLFMSRFMEVIGNFPIFLLQLTLLAFLDQNYGVLLFVMTIAGWIPYARYVRAEMFRLRRQEFIQAATVIGTSRTRIFFRHLLPNAMGPVIAYIPFDLSGTIASLGALSFLGFGEPINVASIGELLKQAKEYFQQAWWLPISAGGLLFVLTLSLTVFGSYVRDRMDPRAQE